MERTYINDLIAHTGQKVKIQGWIYIKREHGNITFLVIRDVSGTAQVVVTKESALLHEAEKLTLESVVEIIGKVKEEKQAPNGIEVLPESLKVLSVAATELPIPVYVKSETDTDRDLRLDWRWLDLRKPEKLLIFKVWTTFEHAFREFCVKNGFIEIHSPKLTISATESGAELFEVKYFDKKAFLAQSPQLYKQMAMASGFEKVFEVGPVFRANPSFTSRHDTEFTMYDIEMSFIESHEDLMRTEEEMIAEIFKHIKEQHGEEIKRVFNQEVIVPTLPFPRITLRESKAILEKLGVPNERGEDFSPEEERAISKYVKEKYDHDFVFVHTWPASVRAFYSMKTEEDASLTKTFDLLYKGLEITSGAQREHRPEKLKEQIEAQGLDSEAFKSYINFFKYGCPPHGGFAPGPTRILMKLLGFNNVREVTYLYRGVNRLTP